MGLKLRRKFWTEVINLGDTDTDNIGSTMERVLKGGSRPMALKDQEMKRNQQGD